MGLRSSEPCMAWVARRRRKGCCTTSEEKAIACGNRGGMEWDRERGATPRAEVPAAAAEGPRPENQRQRQGRTQPAIGDCYALSESIGHQLVADGRHGHYALLHLPRRAASFAHSLSSLLIASSTPPESSLWGSLFG